jgi:hypothetical protein
MRLFSKFAFFTVHFIVDLIIKTREMGLRMLVFEFS